VSRLASSDGARIDVSAFGVSDIGRVRKNNEDTFVIFNLSTGEDCRAASPCSLTLGALGLLLLVADGMGGEVSGEVASSMCATTVPQRLRENLKSLETVDPVRFALKLREAVQHANQLIFQKARSDRNFRGMGTTATAAAVLGSSLFLAQVGDSRAYLSRNGAMDQLTRDQTFLNYLADIGAQLPEDLENDSRRSILTQAVGASETLGVKMTYCQLRDGDCILLCSDGLYNMVKPPSILGVVNGRDSLADKCRTLVQMAKDQGGTDNITVIMAEVAGPGLLPADSGAAVAAKEFREEDFDR